MLVSTLLDPEGLPLILLSESEELLTTSTFIPPAFKIRFVTAAWATFLKSASVALPGAGAAAGPGAVASAAAAAVVSIGTNGMTGEDPFAAAAATAAAAAVAAALAASGVMVGALMAVVGAEGTTIADAGVVAEGAGT